MHLVVPHLVKLRKTATRRLARFKTEVEACPLPLSRANDRVIASATIEAANLWSATVRCFYVSCCLEVKRTSGPRVGIVTLGVNSPTEAINFAMATLKPTTPGGPPWRRRDEPAWHETASLVKLMQALGSSNFPAVTSALSIRTRVFSDLPVFRNFFAHRSDDTAGRVRRIARGYRISPNLRPAEILTAAIPGRPQRLLSDWLDDLSNATILLCQ
jgi:hypothetical protein